MPQIHTTIPEVGAYTAPTEYANNKLDMVNRCLRAIGETPLPNGTLLESLQLGIDAEIAARIVDETMKEVQSVGWYFNTDYDFKLYPDEDNFITVPPNMLRMDTYDDNQYILRGRRVYDVYNKTFVIEKDYITADVVWLVDYELLPVEAYEYIANRAARKFGEEVIAAAEIVEVTRSKETDAYIRLQRRQLQTQDYNIQNKRVSTRTHNGYLYKGLYNSPTRR